VSSSVVQVVEAISVSAVPVGTGVVAYVRWRKNSEEQRYQREQAASVAAQKAATDARADERVRTDQLIAEKQATIDRLELALQQEQRENERLQNLLLGNTPRNRTSGRNHEP
jgi:uncharacterized protein HemX